MATETKSFDDFFSEFGTRIKRFSFKFLIISLLVAGVYIFYFDAELNTISMPSIEQDIDDHRSMLTSSPNISNPWTQSQSVNQPKSTAANVRCPAYFKQNSEEFMIHKGQWVYKSNAECQIFDSNFRTESFGDGVDITQIIPNQFKVRSTHNENFMTNAIEMLTMAKNKFVTDYYPDKTNERKLCDGNMLFDEHKNQYSVYTFPNECHYKIFTTEQTKKCMANRNIWILHESVGRDIFYFLSDLINNQSNAISKDEKSEKLHTNFNDISINFTLHFDRLSDFVPAQKQFLGLTVFKSKEMMKAIGEKIEKYGFSEIMFGSIMHDIVHWNWYKEEVPAEYYESVKHSLLTLCGIFMHKNVNDFKIWIYLGLMPPLGDTDFGYLAFFYSFWSRAFLKGVHDFLEDYPEYAQHIVLMDTVHASTGHLSHNYSDDVHFGKIAKRHMPNVSTVVNDMSGHIILNYFCDE